MPPLINILIRTSNRPEAFSRALRSVYGQNYSNIRVIVSYDTEQKPVYIPEGIEAIRVARAGNSPFFYNLYCNELKGKVTNGYFMFLDDDDVLNGPNAIRFIEPYLSHGSITICKYLRKGRIKPVKDGIEKGMIGMPCFVLHHSHKDLADFDDTEASDFNFIKEVSNHLPVIYAPIALVDAGRRSFGRME